MAGSKQGIRAHRPAAAKRSRAKQPHSSSAQVVNNNPAAAPGRLSQIEQILALKNQIGNRSVSRMLAAGASKAWGLPLANWQIGKPF